MAGTRLELYKLIGGGPVSDAGLHDVVADQDTVLSGLERYVGIDIGRISGTQRSDCLCLITIDGLDRDSQEWLQQRGLIVRERRSIVGLHVHASRGTPHQSDRHNQQDDALYLLLQAGLLCRGSRSQP